MSAAIIGDNGAVNHTHDAVSQPAAACLIDPVRLRQLLGAASQGMTIDALPSCESTSTVLLQRARQGATTPSLLVADQQTAGRGRRGRRWLSSAAASLTFSLLWRCERALADMTGLSLAAGVAVARALESCGASPIGLKWPNDVLLDCGKVAGILIDLETATPGVLAVIGIGLNLQLPRNGDEDMPYPPAALAQSLASLPERHQLLACLLRELIAVLDCFAEHGFSALRDDWQARHAWQERRVRLCEAGLPEREGICLGADVDGALLLQTKSGKQRFFSGDVSLRAR